MQSEFEKQVQQRMEELKLTPSEPVWLNIKEQIRKKRKKRMLVWIPLLFLLLGGGTGSLYQFGVFNKTEKTTARKEQKNSELRHPAHINKQPEKKVHPPAIVATPETIATEAVSSSGPKVPALLKNFEKRYHTVIAKRDRRNGNLPVSADNPAPVTITGREAEQSTTADSKNMSMQPADKDSIPIAAAVAVPAEAIIPVPAETKQDSIASDNIKKQQLKQSKNKLIVGIFGSAGYSGTSSGLGMLKSMDLNYSSPPNGASAGPGPVYLPPSGEKNNFGFSAGLTLKKKLSDRLSFVTGLGYNYFSTKIMVGQSVRRDTVLTSSFNSVRVDQYYRNSNIGLTDYTNQYHFLSIPLGIDFSLFKDLPLGLQAGLSVAQLISTNALTYNSSAQVYYRNKDAVTKTQFLSHLGLSYGFRGRGFTLSAGPHLQYALSNQMRQGSANHLFSIGGRVELMFNK